LFREQVDRALLAVRSDSNSSYFHSNNDTSGTDDLAICAVTTAQVLKIGMLCKVLLHWAQCPFMWEGMTNCVGHWEQFVGNWGGPQNETKNKTCDKVSRW